MKSKKDKKFNKIGGEKGKKKLSTADAIALTLSPKQPKYIEPLDKRPIVLPNKDKTTNNINTLSNQHSEPSPKQSEIRIKDSVQPIDNVNENGKVHINIVYNSSEISELKDILTERELRFISYRFMGECTVLDAMKSAGYIGYSDEYLYRLARNLVQRYESQAQDHRIIARALGAGEVAIIQGIYDLARTAKSEMTQLNAWCQLSKILGLTKEQLDGAGGITIIFEASGDGQARGVSCAPAYHDQARPAALPVSTKPLMITK